MHVRASGSKPAVFEKIGECLYKLASTGGFYARVWVRGKEIRRSLETSDWQLAKRRLRDLRKDLEKLDNEAAKTTLNAYLETCLLYTSPSPRDRTRYRMPSSA